MVLGFFQWLFSKDKELRLPAAHASRAQPPPSTQPPPAPVTQSAPLPPVQVAPLIETAPAIEGILEELMNLPGIGATTAERIVAAGFSSKEAIRDASDDALLQVRGVGLRTLESLRGYGGGTLRPVQKKRTVLDADAQPLSAFNAARRAERGIHEMLGLVRGVLADGIVTPGEASALRKWIQANPEVADVWPGSVMAHLLEAIFADGFVSPDEQEELQELLTSIVGGGGMVAGSVLASALPLTNPPPPIQFTGRVFVFTGHFAFGPRRLCQEAVRDMGGSCRSDVNRETDYLVVGTLGSRDWAHSSFGRKIQKALALQGEGLPLAIVGEDHWVEAV